MEALIEFDPVDALPEGAAIVPDASMAMAWLEEHETLNERVYWREDGRWCSRGWYELDQIEHED